MVLITCSGEVVTLRPDEGTPVKSGCDGILSPKKVPSSPDTPLGCASVSGRVIRADVAELVDGDATEGGCGGRGMGNEALVLSAGTAVG
jgi:hypothetical protein